jgi:hypothetical protein
MVRAIVDREDDRGVEDDRQRDRKQSGCDESHGAS